VPSCSTSYINFSNYLSKSTLIIFCTYFRVDEMKFYKQFSIDSLSFTIHGCIIDTCLFSFIIFIQVSWCPTIWRITWTVLPTSVKCLQKLIYIMALISSLLNSGKWWKANLAWFFSYTQLCSNGENVDYILNLLFVISLKFCFVLFFWAELVILVKVFGGKYSHN